MFPGGRLFTDSTFIIFSKVIAWPFICLCIYMAYLLIKSLLRLSTRSLKALFLVQILLPLSVYVALYPGIIGYDDASAVKLLFAGEPWRWQSLSYSFLLTIGYLTTDSPGFVPGVSVLYFLFLMSYLWKEIDKQILQNHVKVRLAILSLVLSCLPINLGMIVSSNRDVIVAMMMAHVVLLLVLQTEWNKFRLIGFAVFVCTLADMRRDLLPFLVLIPAVFSICKKWKKEQIVLFSAAVFLFGIVFNFYLNRMFEFGNDRRNYTIVSYVLPLSVIIHEKGLESFSGDQQRILSKIMDPEMMVKHYNPNDIDPVHKGALRTSYDEKDYDDFIRMADSVIIDNFGIYLKHRFKLFLSMSNVVDHHGVFFDDFRTDPSAFPDLMEKYKEKGAPYDLHPSVKRLYELLSALAINEIPFTIPFRSLLVPIIFALFLLVFTGDVSMRVASALQLFRLPVFMFFAPAAYFKYVYSMLVFFIIVFPLFLARRLAQNK